MSFSIKNHILAPTFFIGLSSFAATTMLGSPARDTMNIAALCTPLPANPLAATAAALGVQLPAKVHPNQYAIPYTRVSPIDYMLCLQNTFFATLFKEPTGDGEPYVHYLLASMATLAVTLPSLESARRGRPLALALPVVTCMLYQVASAAITVPLFALLFLVASSGGYYSGATDTALDQGSAEAFIIGQVVGFGLTANSMYSATPKALAAFQLFPLRVALITNIWAGLRIAVPYGTGPGSARRAYALTQGIFALSAFGSSAGHLTHIIPRLKDMASVKAFLVPAALRADMTLDEAVLRFIQWDGLLVVVALAALSLFIARTPTDAAINVAILVGGSAFAGPTAAFALIWGRREAAMEDARALAAVVRTAKKE